MEDNFTPMPGDTSIHIPVTFGYRGGRGANVKNKIITIIVFVGIAIIGTFICWKNPSFYLWQSIVFTIIVLWGSLLGIRFIGLKELYFSDAYESMKARNGILQLSTIWGIFDISLNYPYICYFKNGYKGIFVRMERDTITGKMENADFDHYDALGNAYNLAHALNMNITHLDYMDNVGNDPRLARMYNDLNKVSNPDMQDMLIDIYDNLQESMKMNYTSFDVYVFLTRDRLDNFVYNVQSVSNTMLGGNFLTYKVLDRNEIASVCPALFNLEDFSVIEACESVYESKKHKGIIPISIERADGTVEKLNKTQAEKKRDLEEQAKRIEDAKAERKRRKANKKFKMNENTVDISGKDEELNLFGVSDSQDSNLVNSANEDDFNLF